MNKYKTIIVLCFVLCISTACMCLCGIANHYSKITLNKMIQDNVETVLTNIQTSVNFFNYKNFSTIHFASNMPMIKDPTVPIKIKSEELFKTKTADSSLIGLNITDLKGDSYLAEGGIYNFSERDYFKNALKGKETVFGPIINKVTNVSTIFYGAPHYDYEENLTNTFFLAVHSEYLSEICKQNPLLNGGYPAIIKRSTGLVIADVNQEKVLKNNIYDDSAASGSKYLEDMTLSVSAGERGFKLINIDGNNLVMGYAPIENTDWSIVIQGNYNDYNKYIKPQQTLLALFSLFLVMIDSIIIYFIVYKICKAVTSNCSSNNQ